MNFDKLIPFIMTIVIGAAVAGELDTLQRWIWKAQAQLLYQSRASAWGSPSIFSETNNSHTELKKHFLPKYH